MGGGGGIQFAAVCATTGTAAIPNNRASKATFRKFRLIRTLFERVRAHLSVNRRKWRDRLRTEIRAGVNPEAATPVGQLTVGDVADRYLAAFVGKRETEKGVEWTGQHLRPASALQADYSLRIARAVDVPAAHGRTVPFEQKPIGAVTKADLEAIRAACRPHGIVGCNRLLARLRHLFNWAIA